PGTCDRYREAISALVDGEDAGIDPQRVEAHVAGCADCAEYRATAEAVRRQLRVATAVPAPDASRRIARLAAAADRSTSRRAVRLVLVVVAVEIMVLSVVDLITVDGDA